MAIQDDNTILNKGDLKAYHEAIAPMLGGTLLSRTNVSDHYSTDEKIVGVWIDGKPLYSKTLTGSTSIAGNAWSDTGIITPSNIVLIELLPVRYLDESQFQTIPCIGLIDDNNHLQVFNIRNNNYQVSTIYATIYYTKTTDAAGSATATPGAYDINFPNTWKENTEIYFGNGVYGYRYVNNSISVSSGQQSHQMFPSSTELKLISTGGDIIRNGNEHYIFGYADANLSYSAYYYDGYMQANIRENASRILSFDVWITYTK